MTTKVMEATGAAKDSPAPVDVTSQNNIISDVQTVLTALGNLRADMLQYVVPPQGQSNWINAIDEATTRMNYVLLAVQSAKPADFLPGATSRTAGATGTTGATGATGTKEDTKGATGNKSGQGVPGSKT